MAGCCCHDARHLTEVGDPRGTPVDGPGGGQFWAGPEHSAVPAALAALAESFTVALDRPVATRRMWLDSIDLRLYRAGMALTATAGPDDDGFVLELRRTDGATVRAGPETLGRPRSVAGLPDCLRAHLEPVLGVRALLPVVEASGSSVTGRLLGAEGKTVVRLVHECPSTIAGGREQLPGGLWLIGLRGYAAAGAGAGRIAARSGLVRDDGSRYPGALRAAGVDPDATSRPVLEAGLPARVAVARVLLGFLGELEAAVGGTVRDVDIECLHDFRVAVRRSRSAVKLLGDVLPPALVAWVTPQLKQLGDLTTPSRDLDVLLQELPSLTAALPSDRHDDVDPLLRHLSCLRAEERQRLVLRLRSTGFERFRTRWRNSLLELATWDGQRRAGPTAAELGGERLDRAHRRLLRHGSRITEDSPAEALHDLRKRAKEMRYLLEAFPPSIDPADARVTVKELKAVQDVLGTFQDSEAQREALYSFAGDMMAGGGASPRTIFAMGEIAAGLQEVQDSSRAHFAEIFARFARRSTRRRPVLPEPRRTAPARPATALAGAGQ
jgi:CHAD domain-containing protein